MNCKQAKAEIALWVGNDLDKSAERSLRRHLSKCPGCCNHWRKMKASLCILQEADEDLCGTEDMSLWPRVSAALATAEEQDARPSRFNGWVPALAVAAACLAMVSLSNNTPPVEPSSDDALPLRVQPIGGEMLPRLEPPRTFPEVNPYSFDLDSALGLRKIGDRHSTATPKRETGTRRALYEVP